MVLLLALSLGLYADNEGLYASRRDFDAEDIGRVFLEIESFNFFRNNEFSGENAFGYTLPGFRLRPNLSLMTSNRTRLSLGVNMIRFFGANTYPNGRYMGHSAWMADSYQNGFHIRPFYRAEFMIGKGLSLVFGSLIRNNGHRLITPMYYKELNYSSDYEEGIQVLYDSKRLDLDVWLDWESFVFKNNGIREMFSLGGSSRFSLIKNDVNDVYLKGGFVGRHIGGEGDSLISESIENWYNYSLSIGFARQVWGLDELGMEFSFLGSNNTLGDNAHFGSGFGVYPSLFARGYGLGVELAYWQSKGYIQLYGNSLFGNVSLQNPLFRFGTIRLVYLDLEYEIMDRDSYCFGLDFQLYYHLPYLRKRFETEDFSFTEVNNVDVSSFSFGVFLRIKPRVRLIKINSGG